MDDCGEPTTGTILTPVYQIRAVAREEAEKAIATHLALCPFATTGVNERLRTVELRFATLVGLLMGSGVLGGIAGAGLSALIQSAR